MYIYIYYRYLHIHAHVWSSTSPDPVRFSCLDFLDGMAFLLQLLRSSMVQATGILVACPHVRILLGSASAQADEQHFV